MATDDVLVINAAQFTTRTRPSGKQGTVITMKVTSEPITYNVSEAAILKDAAKALARQIREQTEAIATPVKPSTADARAAAERAYTKGKPWALKRFSGGKMGVTPPRVGEQRQFNHSGRLAESIVARYSEKTREFYINYAANRWNPKDWSSSAAMQVAVQRWVSMVPALREPGADLGVQRAFRESSAEMVEKHKMGTTHQNAVSKAKIALQILQAAAKALGA